MSKNKEVLGISVDGVLVDPIKPTDDLTYVMLRYPERGEIYGVFPALEKLSELRFGDEIYFFSEGSISVHRRVQEWLDNKRAEFAAINLTARLISCASMHEKAEQAVRLRVTCYIDNQLKTLGMMDSVPRKYLFRARPEQSRMHMQHRKKVTEVQWWQNIIDRELGELKIPA